MAKGILKGIFLVFLIIFSTSAVATERSELSFEERFQDAVTLAETFSHYYGPAPWKEKLGINLDKNANQLMSAVDAAKTDEAYYDALIHFTAGFKDAHVSSTLPSTHVSTLGFVTKAYGDDVLIVDINRTLLPEEKYPFQIGDRLVSIDNKFSNQIIEELSIYFETGFEKANRQMSSLWLGLRPQSKIPYIPKGNAKVVIASQDDGSEKEITLEWKSAGLTIAELRTRKDKEVAKLNLSLIATGEGDGFDPFHRYLSYGNKKPPFPLWKNFTKRNEAPFLTGTIATNNLTIGYIRLHTWDSLNALDEKEVISFLEKEIEYFNYNTDALILDQTSNNGGIICTGETVAGFFVDEIVPSVRLEVKPTEEWAAFFKNKLKKADERDRKFIENDLERVEEAIKSGARLSKSVAICNAAGMVIPHKNKMGDKIIYKKPKLLLNNELTCSTGDMFAAILQDAGSVTTFGERTMGCGGNVTDIKDVGFSDFATRVTGSLAVRPNEVMMPNGEKTRYIENVGISADLPYAITSEDYYNNFEDYLKAIIDETVNLIE